MSSVLFKNCTIVDATAQSARPGFNILIENNQIKEVTQKEIKIGDGITIDLTGKFIMPGLIDAHVHVTAADINLADDAIPQSEISVQAARFLEEMLQRGFTSVRDAGGADLGLANAINRGLIKGPRLFYSGKALSQTGGHGDFRHRNTNPEESFCQCSSASSISVIADGITEVRKAAREQLRKGATQIKIMASGGVASPTDKITNVQYSLDEIKAIVEEAAAHGTYVMAHAYTPQAIKRCIECGVRSIEHGNLLDSETAALMAAHDVFLVPTLSIYEALSVLGKKLGFPEESLNKLDSVRLRGLEAIQIARSHNIKIGLGTDLLGVEGQTWQSQEFLIRSKVESPFETIKSATAINAELLNHHNKLGVIVPGALADLLVISGNPLDDIKLLTEQGKYLDLIMKDGVIYKNRL